MNVRAAAGCAGCHRALAGSYITALGKPWHIDCFRCAGCGQPIGQRQFVAHAGQPYHESCYQQRHSPRCAACGQPITGAYTQALGKNWHPEHFVCARCHKPFAGQQFYERDGQAYCQDDYHALFSPRCAICDQPMTSAYLTNAWGDQYCAKHQGQVPDCFSCSRPICERVTGGAVRYADGRNLCNRCRRTAVDQAPAGQPLLEEVRRTLARAGLSLGQTPIPLRLTDQTELSRLSHKAYAHRPTGMARTRVWTQNGRIVRREVEEILILYGLPAEHFQAVVAHELGHAWLFLNEYPSLPPVVQEGICELFAYVWLREQHTPEAAFRLRVMEENRDPVYGVGYRAAQQAMEKHGLPNVLAEVKRKGRI